MRRLIAGVVCLAFGGCATLGSGDYRLHVGDELKIVVFDELDEQVLIRPDHKISLPIIGEVSTRQKTAEQLSQELTAKYKMSTVVMVQEYRTWQQTFKDALGLARDVFIIFFAVQRIADD